MEALTRLVTKINTTLSDLTASQRIAIGLCAVVIVGSFMWLIRWSTEPEYVRLLDQRLSMESLQAAGEALPEGKYRIAGDYILVNPAEKHELIWELHRKGAMPEETSISFKSIFEGESPFRPEGENKFRRLVALQSELARVIASSKMIQSAEVFITDTTKRRISARNITATASVKVTTAPGHSLNQEIVNACSALVAGSVPGLLPHNVSVIDGNTMMAYKTPNPEDSFAQGMLRERNKHEEILVTKISNQLSYIPGVRVAVSVELDPSTRESHEFEYTEPAIKEEQSSSTDSRTGSSSGETGVGPNVGQALTGSGATQSEISEESTSTFQEQKLRKEQRTKSAPYAVQRALASIAIPRSYLAGIVKSTKPPEDEAEPTSEEIDDLFNSESQRVRSIVGNILLSDNESDVAVTYIHDVQPGVTILPDGTFVASSQSSGGGVLTGVQDHVSEIILGLMALTGMFLLTRMARKSARLANEWQEHDTKPKEGDEDDGEPLTISAGPIGRVDPTGDSLLEGHEVDEHSVRATQVGEQVRSLVEEDPVAVSKLLRRWTDSHDD